MATVSRRLPRSPSLEIPEREAAELLAEVRAGLASALARVESCRTRAGKDALAFPAPQEFQAEHTQFVLAREYGFADWREMADRIRLDGPASFLEVAIRADDRETALRLIREHPLLLELPLRSGNWGPPLSHAANLGRLELIREFAARGAKDVQHAFDRAILQGQIECARWLLAHGGRLEPGIVMGACETLDQAGLSFLSEVNAPFTDHHGNQLAPLGLILETYSRDPDGKHGSLEVMRRRGYEFPDTAIMAFHRGDVPRLAEHLREDPALLERRFTTREIYPPELGCGSEGKSGMCGTPLEGSTFLHLAIDFDEVEIFRWLLEQGADVNARTTVDEQGFGGHTPLFNAVVSCAFLCGRQKDARMTRQLLERGAAQDARANLRKFLDWIDNPRWHEARAVTPLEWGRGFPEANWANPEVMRLLGE